MNDNILLFHIGEAKTGTTALQHFLYENKQLIENTGWSYPDFTIGGGDVKNGRCFYKKGNHIDELSEEWREVWRKIKESVMKGNVIISAEEINLDGWKEILIEAKKHIDNVAVIIYLRRQDRFVESAWNQLVKMGLRYSFIDFLKILENKLDVKYTMIQGVDVQKIKPSLFYYKRLKELENIVGKDKLCVRVYEKGQMQGERQDVISDFCYSLGMQIDFSKVKDPTHSNERWEENFIEMKRVVNDLGTVCTEQNYEQFEKYINQIVMESCRIKKTEKNEKGYFSEQKRIEFLTQFKEENEKVAREYLNRKDGILFYDDKLDYDCDLSQATSMEDAIIKMFSYAIIKQDEKHKHEILQLKYQNKMLVQNIIMLYRGNRKLVYFAAGQRCNEVLKVYQLPVEFLLDNDKEKTGKLLDNIEIKNPIEIDDWSQYFIIVTCAQSTEIEHQLNSYGLHKNEDYILLKEIL